MTAMLETTNPNTLPVESRTPKAMTWAAQMQEPCKQRRLPAAVRLHSAHGLPIIETAISRWLAAVETCGLTVGVGELKPETSPRAAGSPFAFNNSPLLVGELL